MWYWNYWRDPVFHRAPHLNEYWTLAVAAVAGDMSVIRDTTCAAEAGFQGSYLPF